MQNQIDIEENYILKIDSQLMDILLQDRTTKNNIIWATDNYAHKGVGYQENDNISLLSVTGRNGRTIKPRTEKSKKEVQKRTKDKAEVFTPSWICNAQNNLVDNAWFGRENVFNTELQNGWKTNKNKVEFPDGKNWQDYVKDTRLEISCGEAPYLVSRYDTVTGEIIPITDRIGLLDRKLRVVSENVDNEQDWVEWAKTAIKNTYGYDWQGDNVLLARENLLFTFADYYYKKFNVAPIKEYLIEVAEIISWNIWQMDGLKCVVPNSCHNKTTVQYTLFGEEEIEEICEGCKNNDIYKHNGIYCKIKDWDANKTIKFVSLIRRK